MNKRTTKLQMSTQIGVVDKKPDNPHPMHKEPPYCLRSIGYLRRTRTNTNDASFHPEEYIWGYPASKNVYNMNILPHQPVIRSWTVGT
jgi:hypothetical protein